MGSSRRGHRVRQAVAWTGRDLRWGVRLWIVNDLAGHRLVPRLARHVVYRAMGLAVDTLDVASGVTITGGRGLRIGSDTFVNHGVYLEAAGGVVIGERCAIGPEVMVLSTGHPVDPSGWSDDLVRSVTTIGDRVWLAARVMVLPGSRVPADSVVAAGSVVRGPLERSGVYAGDPARLVSPFRPAEPRAGDDEQVSRPGR